MVEQDEGETRQSGNITADATGNCFTLYDAAGFLPHTAAAPPKLPLAAASAAAIRRFRISDETVTQRG